LVKAAATKTTRGRLKAVIGGSVGTAYLLLNILIF